MVEKHTIMKISGREIKEVNRCTYLGSIRGKW
jgi:hypothetical protein